MIILNQIISAMQNYAIWIQIALPFILKLNLFIKDIANDVEKRFDTSDYAIECNSTERPLLIGKN